MSSEQSFPQVLFVTLNYPPPLVGGSLVYLHHLLTHLPADHIQVLTSSKGKPEAEKEYDLQFPFRVTRLPVVFISHQTKMSKLEKMRLLLHWVLGLWRHIHRSLTDVVVMHDVYNLGVFTRVICAIRGVPYFVICYGEELSQALIVNSVRSWLRKHIYQWVLNGAKGIISIAAPTTKLLQRFGVPNNRVTEIYPPTPVPEQEPSPEVVESFRHKYNLLGKRIVASGGRLISRKGHDHLLKAFPTVAKEFPDAVLVIAGTGPMENYLQDLAVQLGISQQVRFLGWVEKCILDTLYATCELFIMPNRAMEDGDIEGYGLVFNEANSFGRPAVGGNSGGTPNSIIDGLNGLLVNGNDIDAIAQAMITLLRDKELASRLGEQGKNWVLNERSPAKAAADFASMLTTMVQ